MSLCECGCGGEVKPGNRYIHGHNSKSNHPMKGKHRSEKTKQKIKETQRINKEIRDGKRPAPELPFCKCGCGGRVTNPNNEYINGHNKSFQDKHHTEESKQKNRESNLGKPSAFKGKHHTDEAKQKIRETHLGKKHTEGHNQKIGKSVTGEKNGMYGKYHSIETKQKLSSNHANVSGESNPMYGRTGVDAPMYGMTGEKAPMYGKEAWCKGKTKDDNETLKIISEKQLKNWQDPKFIKMMVDSWYRSGQTRPEKEIDSIVQLLIPKEYKFNGNFELGITIGGKIPDFVNINGKKKAIDVFGDWCHRNDDPQIRIDLFKKYGWDLLVIWEHELKDRDAVIQKIVKFHGIKSDYVLTQKTLDTWLNNIDKKTEKKEGEP